MSNNWTMCLAGIAVNILLSSEVFAAGAGMTYAGRLVGPDGIAVTSANVQYRLQIRTPGSENCLMYEEIQTKDMTASNGVFAITINDGSGARQDSNTYSIDQIFANRGGFTFPAGYCISGSTYAPNPSDGRRLAVYFNDGTFSGWEPAPSQAVNFVPMTVEAMQVGGYKKEQLLKIADGVSQMGTELNATSWANLLALLGGTSTQYLKPTDPINQLVGASIPAPVNGQSLRWNSALNLGAGGWENFTAGSASAVTLVSSANADITVANGGTAPLLTLNSGTSANQIVKLDATAKIPVLDGSQLTNLSASNIGSGVLPIAHGGTNSSAALMGNRLLISSATQIVEAPAMSDGQIIVGKMGAPPQVVTMSGDTSVSNTGIVIVGKIQGFSVAATAPALGAYMKWNNTFSQWEPSVYSSCSGADQVMHYNSITDVWSCDYIGLSANVTGVLGVANGGTGTTSATAAFNALAPAQTGNSGKFLTSDGVNASWAVVPSSQWTTTGSDIYYTAGKVGVGTAILTGDNKVKVDFSSSDATASTYVGVKSSGNINPAANSSNYYAFDASPLYFGAANTGKIYGINSVATSMGTTVSNLTGAYIESNLSSGNSTDLYGSSSKATVGGSTTNAYGAKASVNKNNGDVATAYGVKADVINTFGLSNIPTAYGGHFMVQNATAGSNTTTAYGVYSSVSATAGTVGTGYGIYVGGIQATSKYSVYASDATAPSYYAGNVGIGTASPAALLDVNGTMRVSQICDSTGANCKTVSGGWTAAAGLSALTAATTTDIIDNTNYAQTWIWSTATTQNPMVMTANSLTTGSLLSLSSSSASLNSTNGLLSVSNTSASTAGTVARIQSNSTVGSGLTVLANGNVGIGTVAPAGPLDVEGGTAAASTNGGSIKLISQNAGSGNQNGGQIALTGGASSGTGAGGDINIVSGAGTGNPSFTRAGNILIANGASWSPNTLTLSGGNFSGQSAASLTFTGTAGTATGAVTLSNGASGSAVGAGGNVTIQTTNVGAGWATNAGSINITAGNGDTSAAGGVINITAGGGGASNVNGSNVVINGGAKGGSGADGNVILAGSRGSVGIGTGTPAAPLHVKTTSVQTNSILESNCSGCSSLVNVYNAASIAGGSNSGIQFSVANTANIYGSIVGFPFNVSNGILMFSTNSGGSLTEKMRIDYAGNIGVGTASPDSLMSVSTNAAPVPVPGGNASGTVLHVSGSDNNLARVLVDAFGAGMQASVTLRGARGTGATPSALQSGDWFSSVSAKGYGASMYGPTSSGVGFIATENWTNSANGSAIAFLTSLNGTTAATERMRIDQNGNIGIGSVTPQATLDVGGYARLKSYSAQPVACVAGNAGAIALTSNYTGCTCNGSSWIKLADAAACVW